MTNTELLKDTITTAGYKLCYVAKEIGVSYQSFWAKLNNINEFKASEIYNICKLLALDSERRDQIFFAQRVE